MWMAPNLPLGVNVCDNVCVHGAVEYSGVPSRTLHVVFLQDPLDPLQP